MCAFGKKVNRKQPFNHCIVYKISCIKIQFRVGMILYLEIYIKNTINYANLIR